MSKNAYIFILLFEGMISSKISIGVFNGLKIQNYFA